MYGWLKVRTGIAAALVLSATTAPAIARERLVVLMVADADPALADDLTEVAIATLAERRDRELVGARELRARLADVLPEGGLAACVDRVECLARVGVVASAARAVLGRVHSRGEGHHLELTLAETRTGEILGRVSTAVPAGIDPLIAAVRAGVGRLLAPDTTATHRTPPAVSLAALPSEHTAAVSLVSKAPEPARPHAWVPYAGGGAAVLAAIAFSAAAVTGTIAGEDPVGDTRVLAQADLEHRKAYATTANELLIAGGVLTAAAGAAFVWWLRNSRAH